MKKISKKTKLKHEICYLINKIMIKYSVDEFDFHEETRGKLIKRLHRLCHFHFDLCQSTLESQGLLLTKRELIMSQCTLYNMQVRYIYGNQIDSYFL